MRVLEKLLLAAGLLAVAIWVGSIVRTSISQDWANWAFDRKLHNQPTTVGLYLHDRLGPRPVKKPPAAEPNLETKGPSGPSGSAGTQAPPVGTQAPPAPEKPPALGTGDLIGRLEIPRLKLHAMVREGTVASTLDVALGHVPGTALPGQQGNIGVAGHRDALFRGLGRIHKSDRIEFRTLSGNYEYEVESTSIVKPQKVSVLDPGPYPEITLVTCYPFHYIGAAPNRFIVKARLVSPEASETASANASPPVAPKQAEAAPAVEPSPAAPVKPAAEPVKRASVERHPTKPTARKVFFHVSDGRSRILVPGISLGVDWSDPANRRMNGWMWVMPDRRTIRLTNQHPRQPMVFYGRQDGKRRELVITSIGRNSVSGYLQVDGG